jgi:hypothetical protein
MIQLRPERLYNRYPNRLVDLVVNLQLRIIGIILLKITQDVSQLRKDTRPNPSELALYSPTIS